MFPGLSNEMLMITVLNFSLAYVYLVEQGPFK